MGKIRKPIEAQEAETRAASFPDWKLSKDRKTLARTLVFEDFGHAFRFMTEVAGYAELVDHHPEWCNVWNRVDMTLTTHSAQGLTELDFEFATFVDRLGRGYTLTCAIDRGPCGGCS